MIHRAKPNISTKRWAGFAFRYMPRSSNFDRKLALAQYQELIVIDLSARQLHLVRGMDQCGKIQIFKATF